MWLIDKLDEICSIRIKNENVARNIIFILCLISIIAFSTFLFRSFTGFYGKVNKTMQNSTYFNMQNSLYGTLDNVL